MTVKSMLVRQELFLKTCTVPDSQVCQFEGTKGACRVRSMTYCNTCLKCKQEGEEYKYWDESSLSLYERANQHVKGGENCCSDNHIWQHIANVHPEGVKNIRETFKFEVVQSFRSAYNPQIHDT